MRRILIITSLVVLIVLSWYLFMMPYDFKVTFTARALPGTINQTLKLWDKSLDNASILNQSSINSVEQQLVNGDYVYKINWEINLINDSTSKVIAYISEPGHSIYNKIRIPFQDTRIEQISQDHVKTFYNRIKEHLGFIKVKIDGMSETDRTFCVYTSVETSQIGKAKGMMHNYPLLTTFIADHNIQPNGLPIVEITDWEMNTDQLKFNFCFPIIKTDSLPKSNFVDYKWLEPVKAIKAVYNGNYITSDRAWYELLHYADKNGIEVEKKPIEVYYNNPNLGANEKEWQTDIYLPIKEINANK